MEDASIVFQSLCFSKDLAWSSALKGMHGDLAVFLFASSCAVSAV